MSPRSRGAQNVLDLITKPSATTAHVCRSCRINISKRTYASAATAQTTVEAPPISQVTGNQPDVSPVAHPGLDIKAGVLLSRPPLTTPDLHPFETAYHLYQRRLNERLVLPFTQYFYFRRGTPAFEHWKERRTKRAGAATRDIGKYNAYLKDSWNDEATMGDQSGQPAKIVEQLIEEEGRGAEFAGTTGEARLGGLRRTTDADSQNNQRSLERRLNRTLYLLVKNKKQSKDQPDNSLWKFPSGSVEDKEGLKEAAQRILGASCGVNMNSWFVGNHPIGHYIQDLRALRDAKKIKKDTENSVDTVKTFFMKARIMAGQADLQSNSINIEDYKWLSKEEIQSTVSPGYWFAVKNMLVEQ